MIGTNLNLVLPLLTDTMATIVAKTATALSAIEVSIADQATVSAINIASAFTINRNQLTNVAGTTYVDGNNPTAAGSVYYHSNEVYLVDGHGPIKLTSVGAINVSGIGGIGGDYGGLNPALESYNLASGQYRFYINPATPTWADLAAHAMFSRVR